MRWDFCKITTPIARKEYKCDTADWIINGLDNQIEINDEDLAIIEKHRLNGWVIKKGDKYMRCSGMFDGEFTVFTAILELDRICKDYGLYPDD